jgi:hypothetical protein
VCTLVHYSRCITHTHTHTHIHTHTHTHTSTTSSDTCHSKQTKISKRNSPIFHYWKRVITLAPLGLLCNIQSTIHLNISLVKRKTCSTNKSSISKWFRSTISPQYLNGSAVPISHQYLNSCAVLTSHQYLSGCAVLVSHQYLSRCIVSNSHNFLSEYVSFNATSFQCNCLFRVYKSFRWL